MSGKMIEAMEDWMDYSFDDEGVDEDLYERVEAAVENGSELSKSDVIAVLERLIDINDDENSTERRVELEALLAETRKEDK